MRDDEIASNPLFRAVNKENELATKLILDYTGRKLMKTYCNPYVDFRTVFELANKKGNANIISLLAKYQ